MTPHERENIIDYISMVLDSDPDMPADRLARIVAEEFVISVEDAMTLIEEWVTVTRA